MAYTGAVQNNGAAYLLCFLTGTMAAMSWLRAWENLRGLEVVAGRLSVQRAGSESKLPLEIRATGSQAAWGLEVLSGGSVLAGMLLGAMAAYIIDRRLVAAA